MSEAEAARIRAFFAIHNIRPQYLQHEAVITSQDAARTRGFSLRQGIKAILLTNGKDEWVVVDIPGDCKVDLKKVAGKLGWSKGRIRMATAEEVEQKTGCQIGAVPPFGHKEKIHILIDPGIYDNEENAFNIGLRTESVIVKTSDMKNVFELLGAEEGEFSR